MVHSQNSTSEMQFSGLFERMKWLPVSSIDVTHQGLSPESLHRKFLSPKSKLYGRADYRWPSWRQQTLNGSRNLPRTIVRLSLRLSFHCVIQPALSLLQSPRHEGVTWADAKSQAQDSYQKTSKGFGKWVHSDSHQALYAEEPVYDGSSPAAFCF